MASDALHANSNARNCMDGASLAVDNKHRTLFACSNFESRSFILLRVVAQVIETFGFDINMF